MLQLYYITTMTRREEVEFKGLHNLFSSESFNMVELCKVSDEIKNTIKNLHYEKEDTVKIGRTEYLKKDIYESLK